MELGYIVIKDTQKQILDIIAKNNSYNKNYRYKKEIDGNQIK